MVRITVRCGNISFPFELEGKSRRELLEAPLLEAFAMARSKTQHHNLRLASKPQCLRHDDFEPKYILDNNGSLIRKKDVIDCIALSQIGGDEETLGIYRLDTTLPVFREVHDLRLLPYFPHGLDIDCLPEITFISFGRNIRPFPNVYIVPPADTMLHNQMNAFGYPILSSSSPTVNDLFQVACKIEGVDGACCLTLVSSGRESVTKTFSLSSNHNSEYDNCRLHDLGLSGPMICAFLSSLSVTVNVAMLTGRTIRFCCKSSDTVDSLRLQIEQTEHIPRDQQQLFYARRHLDQVHQTLSYYNINDEAAASLWRNVSPFVSTL